MKKFVLKYVKPYLFSLFFVAAMTSLLWITMTYGSLSAVPLAAGLCAMLYTGLALAAVVNLFRGNKLFEGSSMNVLSVGTQKAIRAAGVAFALPALIYCAIFAYLVKTHDFSETATQQVNAFEKFELDVFGTSKIWSFICPVSSAPVALEPVSEVQVDVDYGPYMAAMQREIKKVWSPEKSYSSKHTEVFFTVDKIGNVSRLRVERSSGSESSDKAALDAVEMAAPFRELPDGSPASVDIKFSFDYNMMTDTTLQTSNADMTSDALPSE